MITLVVISPVRVYRQCLVDALKGLGGVQVLGEGSTSADALSCSSSLRPAVALLDLGVAGMVTAIPTLRRVAPDTRLIALAVDVSDPDTLLAAEAGVQGFIDREQSLDDAATAITGSMRGEAYFPPRLAGLLLQRLRDTHSQPTMTFAENAASLLTRREMEVFFLMTRDLSNAEIATRLTIGIPTVKTHVRAVVRKMGVSCRKDLLKYRTY